MKEIPTVSWEYRQRLGEGLVLPCIDLFNVHLVNTVMSNAGSKHSSLREEPNRAAFELQQDLEHSLTWVNV